MNLALLPDTTQAQNDTAAIAHGASALQITDNAGFETAGGILRGIKTLMRQIDETFQPGIDAAHKTHKTLIASRDAHLKPLQEAERIVKGKLLTYQAEERRKAEEDARRQAEEARKAEAERLLQEAMAAEADGDAQAADAIMHEAVTVIAPVVQPQAAPKAAGISTRETWKGEVVSIEELIKAAAEIPAYSALLLPNQAAINRMAGAMKGSLAIPGIKPYKEQIISSRAL